MREGEPMGIIAIVLVLCAWTGSAVLIWQYSGWVYGAVEIILIAGGLLTVSFVYCTHCPLHRKGCVHGFLGIPARLMKDRCAEPYTLSDYILSLGALLPMIVFPQYWLFKSPIALAAYWLIHAAAVLLILNRVCVQCTNAGCPMNRQQRGFRD